MATLSDLRNRISIRTNRGAGDDSLTNFKSIVEDAVNEFLLQSANLHPYREMIDEDTGTISSGHSLSLPTEIQSDFESALFHLNFVGVASSSTAVIRDIEIRSYPWLAKNFPDRLRSGSNTAIPIVCARFQSTIQFQARVDQTYTVYFVGSHLPKKLTSDGAPNPIPLLDDALVAYGCYAVYEAIEQYDSADRQFILAQQHRGVALLSDWRDPGENFRFGLRGGGVAVRDLLFDPSALKTLYS